MITKKQILSAMLIMVMIFSLASCGKNNPSNTSSGSSSEVTNLKTVAHRVPAGSFIQYYMTQSWTDARWQQELKAMKDAGMQYLIFSPAVIINEKDNTISTIYPSDIPDFQSSYNGTDCIDAVLRNCQKAGIKVFIALNQSAKFWDFGWDTTTTSPDAYTQFWKNNAIISNEIADELYSKYKPKYPDAFYGWYWVHEFWNFTICTNTYEGKCPTGSDKDKASWAPDPSVYTNIIANEAFNPVLDHLKKLDSKMPMMFSNFANQALCTPDSNAKFWSEIIKNTHFRPGDIMAPMDSIGSAGVTIDTLDKWTAGYKKATETNPNLHLWSNNELFVNNTGEIDLLDRFLQQISITSKYAEQDITFSWNHYYSPYNTLPGFNKVYMQYVKYGNIEKNPPAEVDKNSILITKTTDGQYYIEWKEPKDDSGIAAYNVYKGGKVISHIYATRLDGSGSDPEIDSSCTVDSAGTYQIEAIDCAGNKSKMMTFEISDSSSK